MDLSDVGTAAVAGGIVGETLGRLGRLRGREPKADSWREGMYYGGVVVLLIWAFRKLVA